MAELSANIETQPAQKLAQMEGENWPAQNSSALGIAAAASPCSAFDRPTARVRDAVALDADRSASHPHCPALRRGETLADHVCQHVGGEAVGGHPSFGAAAWTAGDEISPLAFVST